MERRDRSLPGLAWIVQRLSGGAGGPAPGEPPQRRERTAPFPPPSRPASPTGQARMRVICAWCGAAIAFRPVGPAQRGLVSHGLCIDCARRIARGRWDCE